jgi:hypothetical protein
MSRSRDRTSKQERRDRKRREAIARHPWRLAHETMMIVAPPWARVVRKLIERMRPAPGEAPVLVEERLISSDPEFREMLHGRFQVETRALGWDQELAFANVQCLCGLAECAINYEVGGKKAFWVDGGLAELLSETTLDISGDALRLPFPSCAFIFDDPRTLDLADALRGTLGTTRASPFRMLTVYVFPIPSDFDEVGLRFAFLADAFDGEWPYLVTRDVPLDGKRTLDAILASHPDPDESDASTDPFFDREELRDLLHLVINAVLYATSREFTAEVRSPPAPGALGPKGKPLELSGETVFYLPNRIVIGPSKGTDDDLPRRRTGRQIEKRFWVRGHWRQPNASWQDRRLRWIAPYLKGPEMTAIIERMYDLKGKSSAS